MYNSSIKGQGQRRHYTEHREIPGKVFFHDMSKSPYHKAFEKADVIFSEIAWAYGFPLFNERAGNQPNQYAEYLSNINKLVQTLAVPAFLICGKPAARYFPGAQARPIKITLAGTNMSGCTLYVWNYDKPTPDTTSALIQQLRQEFDCCLDFSCGYGEHLLSFNDFIASDIDRDCLTYLTEIYEVKRDGETEEGN